MATVTTSTTDYGGTAPVTFSPSQTSTQSQTISSTNGGFGDTSGISAGVAQVNATFSELIMNGGIAAGVGLIATSVFLYAIVICRKRKRALTKTAPLIPQKNSLSSSSSSFLVINPLKERQQRPLSRPTTKSLKKAGSGVKR